MAVVITHYRNERIAHEIQRRFAERGIFLSSDASNLLRLTVESWFDDMPNEYRTRIAEREEWTNIGMDIALRAMEEPHLARHSRQGGVARYTDLMYALAVSGREVLRKMFDKGF